MGVKKLTVTAETVELAIERGLAKIGLEQRDTMIEILQHNSNSMFGHRDAVVAIFFDEEESDQALILKTLEDFRAKFKFRFSEGQAQILVPACFYDDRYVKTDEERVEFLKTYLADHEVPDPDMDKLATIVSDFQHQYNYESVLSLDCQQIGEDGMLFLNISEDEMECRAIVFFDLGEITEEMVVEALAEKGVTYGLCLGNLRKVLKHKYTGYFTVARGKPVVNDRPGEIEKFFQEDEHKEFAKMMEYLTIDTRSVKEINIADRNQILMRIGSVIPGHDGKTITGHVIPKEELGEENHGIDPGPNVYFSDCGREVYAKKSGHILWRPEDGYIDVEPVYIVEGNVDFAEGNIIGFVGKVIIKGDVKPKFSVVAEGDIEIHGSVEDATIRSTNGNVFVAGSVIHKQEGVISARKTVHCNICTNAKIKSNKIIVEKESMNSNLEAITEILAEGTPGAIIGGELHATKRIRVNSIGSERGVHTKVHVGDVTPLKKRLRKLQQRMMNSQRQLKETKQVLTIFENKMQSAALSESEQRQLSKAQSEIRDIEDTIEVTKEAETKLMEDIETRKGARLEILKELHRGVDVNIFEGYMVPESKEQFCGFHCKNGKVKRFSL